jgi:hypothetical protein
MPLFQPFEIQPKSIAVPFKDFYAVAVSIAENKQRHSERVELETEFNDCG